MLAGGFVAHYGRASLAARLRHFGSYALIEDNSVRADPLTIVNGRVGYSFGRIEVAADVINIFNSRDKEIEYLYASRLPGEPDAGIEDRHYKSVEPRQFRVSATVKF